jgi:alkylation response protein AidB-like acyl-CoA dehydrogenase
VDAQGGGVACRGYPTQDGLRAAELRLSGVKVRSNDVLGDPGKAAAVIERVVDGALAAIAAEAVGAMSAAHEITIDYLKTRKQFGVAIGSFQALQHRAADLKIQVALTRASVEAAAATLDASQNPALRQAAVSRAKARAAEASMLVTRQCIQLHGGIGYTDEYDIGLFLRKTMVLANQYGSAALHRTRYASVAPDEDE